MGWNRHKSIVLANMCLSAAMVFFGTIGFITLDWATFDESFFIAMCFKIYEM